MSSTNKSANKQLNCNFKTEKNIKVNENRCDIDENSANSDCNTETTRNYVALKSTNDNNNKTTVNYGLKSIPLCITQHLINSTKLDLTNNNLTELPTSIAHLTNLQTLILDDNRLFDISRAINKLHKLRELSLMSNGFMEFPQNITNLQSLEILNISNNKIKCLPPNFKKLYNLRVLNLSKNNFKHVPNSLHWGILNLDTLDVSDNKYMNLNGCIASENLRNFFAKNNEKVPTIFPNWIYNGKNKDYNEINFEGTYFEVMKIPKIENKITIRKLNLQRCLLSDYQLKIILRNINSIKYLKLGNNKNNNNDNYKKSRNCSNFFTLFPDRLNNPRDLIEININNVHLSKLSSNIQFFTNLRRLDVQKNLLSWLPDEICYLNNLEVLTINNNSLLMLPENIGQMNSLKIIDAANNNITTLPQSICNLKKIEFIDFYNNNLIELPREINRLESLKGLDLEQNPINTVGLKLPASYEALRNQLNNEENDIVSRINGRKESISPESSEIESATTSSNSSMLSWNSWKHNSQNTLESDWGDEYDSADDFDPHYPPIVPTSPPPYKRYIMCDKFAFCPADIHARRIRDVVAEKLKLGILKPPPAIVEGQFDDVEEDES